MLRSFAFLLVPTLLLAACHDDDGAHFSTATDEQRRQLVTAALGDHAEDLLFLPAILFPDEKAACPVRAAQGEKTFTLTGGCDAGPLRVEGAIAVDETETTTAIRWDHFSARDSAGGGETSVDGSYVMTSDGKAERRAIDVRFEGSSPTEHVGLETHLDLQCAEYQSACHAGPGSTVTLEGVGSADISFAYDKPGDRNSRRGTLELTGAETLHYTMTSASRDDDHRRCGPITIDGKDAGELCLASW